MSTWVATAAAPTPAACTWAGLGRASALAPARLWWCLVPGLCWGPSLSGPGYSPCSVSGPLPVVVAAAFACVACTHVSAMWHGSWGLLDSALQLLCGSPGCGSYSPCEFPGPLAVVAAAVACMAEMSILHGSAMSSAWLGALCGFRPAAGLPPCGPECSPFGVSGPLPVVAAAACMACTQGCGDTRLWL